MVYFFIPGELFVFLGLTARQHNRSKNESTGNPFERNEHIWKGNLYDIKNYNFADEKHS